MSLKNSVTPISQYSQPMYRGLLSKLIYFFKNMYLFVAPLGLHHSVWAFSMMAGVGGLLSSCGTQASRGSGFSCCTAWAVGVSSWRVWV